MNEQPSPFSNRHGRRTHVAFTLIELLVVIGIVAVLAVIALPIYGRVTTQGHITVTTSNIRQMSIAFLLFAQENNYQLPGRVSDQPTDPDAPKWNKLLLPYYKDTRVLVSPIDPVNGVSYRVTDPELLFTRERNYTSYVANGYNDVHDPKTAGDDGFQPRLNTLGEPTNTILLGIQYPGKGNFYLDLNDHDQVDVLNSTAFNKSISVYAFADGSVRTLQYIDSPSVDMTKKPPNAGVYTHWLWLMDKANTIKN